MKTALKKPDIKRYIQEEVRRAVKVEVRRVARRFKIIIERDVDEVADTDPSPEIMDDTEPAPDTDPSPMAVVDEPGSHEVS